MEDMITYQHQVKRITDYFKKGETNCKNSMIGMEFEHFVVYKDTLRAVSYYGRGGVEDILGEMTKSGWRVLSGDGPIFELEKNSSRITIEPGAQVELSTKECETVGEIDTIYCDFIKDITPILDANKQMLLPLGYQPVTKASQIAFIPKKRYDYMSAYFKTKGKLAHSMMKGTASIHVSLDYCSEKDFINKYKAANRLTPVAAALFDNAPYFEGEIWNGWGVRINIWNNCDLDRCGVAGGSLDGGYEAYAKYLLNTPPILDKKGDELIFTQDKTLSEVLDGNVMTDSELEYFLTMVFPDVRLKKYMEIRTADALPYPFNMAVGALWKGIMYNNSALDKINAMLWDVNAEDIIDAKNDVVKRGLNAELKGRSIAGLARKMLDIASSSLDDDEAAYLNAAYKIIEEGKTLSDLTREDLIRECEHKVCCCGSGASI